jgi:hypothetical protein
MLFIKHGCYSSRRLSSFVDRNKFLKRKRRDIIIKCKGDLSNSSAMRRQWSKIIIPGLRSIMSKIKKDGEFYLKK